MNLSSTNVLITGANRGLGAAFVEAALARQASSVYAAARNPASLPQFSDAARVIPVRLDVTDQEAIAGVARELDDVNLLISNAGVPCDGPVLGDVDEATFREALEVNVIGPLRLARAFGANLAGPGSGAIFVLSVAAVVLSRSAPMYGASKAAGLMVALGLREQLLGSGATVTAVLPGFIDTDMSARFEQQKASPMQIAERSLDGWLAGHTTVWPDRFAELVHDAIGQPYQHLLDEPGQAMTEVHAVYRGNSPAAE